MTTNQPAEVSLIRDALKSARITQAYAADMTDISRPWANEVLTGRRPAGRLVLCRLAQLAGVTADEMTAAGRPDVAKLIEATPTPTLDHIPTEELLEELRRRTAAQ